MWRTVRRWKICSTVAGDEARHEEAYKSFVVNSSSSTARDADRLAEMMKTNVTMPARLMSDGIEQDLFNRFSLVAQRIGVYTARDYADIIRHLIAYWRIPAMAGLSDTAAQAKEYLCGLAARYERFAERVEGRIATGKPR
jgi:acyl-[acyl-carrier-protein] desaturase